MENLGHLKSEMRNQFSTVGILPEDFSQGLIIIDMGGGKACSQCSHGVLLFGIALVGKVSGWVDLTFDLKYHKTKIRIL